MWDWVSYTYAGQSFLQINGASIDWGPFSNGDTGHTYTIHYTGTGAPITFTIVDLIDEDYTNNRCHLPIEIWELERPPQKDLYPLMGYFGSYVRLGMQLTIFPDTEFGLVFASVTATGPVTLVKTTDGPPAPTGFVPLGPFYDVTVDALFSGETLVRIVYDDTGMTPEEEEGLQMLQWDFLLGDINFDGVVNMRDISEAAMAFGESPDKPRWNSHADVNRDNQINMWDIALIAQDFGEEAEWKGITFQVDAESDVIFGIAIHFSVFGVHRHSN
jgi:hypothetical protein